MATEKRQLSASEKLGYIPAFLSIGATAVVAPLTGLVRGSRGADTYRHHIAHAIIRKFNSSLSSIQSQYFQPTFESIYVKWCASHKIKPEFVTSDSGVRGFWMGDRKTAKEIIIYYHGGGFALDGSDGHITFWYEVQQHLSASGISTAFFFVLYTLTPHRIYPTQLRESVQALQYVIEEYGRPPSQISLAGDSAGGNLAVSVLLHLNHPNPAIEPYTITEKLKGLVLMSPWVSLDVTWPSFEANKHNDYLQAVTEARWADEYLMSQPHDIWTDPATTPASYWKNVQVEHVFVTVGSSEALFDGIEHWVKQYRCVNPDITLEVAKNEVHVAPIVWPMFGDKHETQQGKAIKAYMKQHLAE